MLEAMTGRETPVTAQALFIELRDRGDDLGLATVYRALHLLRDEGRLHEFHMPDGVAFRACAPAPHHHLVCLRCGRVLEQHIDSINAWVDEIGAAGFAVEACIVEVYGICERCQA